MEQKLSDTLVKAIDRSNPMMQNLQLASRFNALVESGGGDVVLEDNKAVTIDASTYSAPVEVTPTSGKDAMKKTTVTLSNIPSPTANTYIFYHWYNEDMHMGYFTLSESPQVGDNAYLENDSGGPDGSASPSKITSVGDTSINIDDAVVSRDESGDVTFTKS